MEDYEVVYNKKYGGFGLSQKGLEKYNKIKKERYPESETVIYDFYIKRDDPILVELVKENPDELSDKYSKLFIKSFPVKYKNYLIWDDYDGVESVMVDYKRYVLDSIKKIVDEDDEEDQDEEDEKIKKIKDLFEEYSVELSKIY